MKSKFALLFIVSMLGLRFIACSQSNTSDTLYVERVTDKILTIYRIPCSHFASAFKKYIKFSTIVNGDTINILKSYLAKVKYTKKYKDVDVRAKFIYESKEGVTIEICTDGYKVLIDSRPVKLNSKFSDFLNSLGI